MVFLAGCRPVPAAQRCSVACLPIISMPPASLLLPSLLECNGATLAEPPPKGRTWHRRLCCASCSQRDPWYTLTLWEGAEVAAGGRGERRRQGIDAQEHVCRWGPGGLRAGPLATTMHMKTHRCAGECCRCASRPGTCSKKSLWWRRAQEIGKQPCKRQFRNAWGARKVDESGKRRWASALLCHRRCPLCLNLQILSTGKRASGGIVMPHARLEVDMCGRVGAPRKMHHLLLCPHDVHLRLPSPSAVLAQRLILGLVRQAINQR